MELITCWSGTMERQGTAAGLSTYNGQSSLGGFEAAPDNLSIGDCGRVRLRHRPLTNEQLAEAGVYLQRGLGIRTVAQAVRANFRLIRTLRDRMKVDGTLVRKSQ